MLRITSSKVVCHAVRAVSSRGSSLTGSLTNAFKGCRTVEDYMAISRHFCSNQNSVVLLVISPTDIVPLAISPTDIVPLAIDEAKKQINGNLLEFFDSEIKRKQTAHDTDDMPAATATIPIPDEFPFTIKDNPWESNVILSRVFHGEKIDVHVYMPYIQGVKSDSDTESSASDDDDDSDFSSSADDSDDDSDEEEEKKKKKKDITVPLEMSMKVSKQDRALLEIMFSVSIDEIKMQWVDLEEESTAAGEGGSSLSYYPGKKNMKTAFVEFLKIRGIDTSTYGFLYSYMVNKEKKCPVAKLEKLREFFAK